MGIIGRLKSEHAVQVQLEIVTLQTLFDCTGVALDHGKDVKETTIGWQLDPGAID